MRTLDRLAESFLGGAALERPGLMFAAGGGKGGSSRKRKPDPDDDDDDLDDDDDEDDDDPDDDDDDDDEDDDDDDLADMDEDTLRAELRKTRESLSKASGSSAAKRKRIKRLRDELAEARKPKPASAPKPRPKGGKDDDAEAPDPEAIKAAAKAEADTAANARIVKAEARGALKSVLGTEATKAQVSRLVGMLKLDDIDVDDDGEVDEDALDEAIEALRKDWPQLFPDAKGKRKPRERVSGKADDGKSAPPRKNMSASELQAAALTGKPVRR